MGTLFDVWTRAQVVYINTSTKTGSGTKYNWFSLHPTRPGINGKTHVSTGRSARGTVVLLPPLASEDGSVVSGCFLFQVISLVALSQNYSRIKSTKELTEYKEAIALDTSSAVM